MQEIKIANPAGWTKRMPMFFAHSGTGQIDALSLINGKIRVMYVRMSGVYLNLVTRSDHTANYHFDTIVQPGNVEKSDAKNPSLSVASIDEVYLEDIDIVYYDILSGNSYDFSIEEVHGSARENEALEFSLGGQFSGQPLSLDVSGDELSKLVQHEDYWSLNSGTFTLADTSISLTGNVGKEPGSMSGYIDLTLAGSGLAALGRSFGISLPDPGEFTLEVKMSVSPASVQASSISLKSAPVELTSDLFLWLHGDRSTLMGTVSVERFDLDLIDIPQDESKPEATVDTDDQATQLLNILNQEIPLDVLQFIDTDLRVRGSDLRLGKVTMKDADSIVSLVDGDLIVPLHANVMGVAIDTQLEIMSGPEAPFLSLTGDTEDADVTSLITAIQSSNDITANIGALDYNIESSGKTLRDFINNIRADIQINNSMVTSAGGQTLFSAGEFAVTRSEDRTWKIFGDGQLFGRPFSTKTLSGKLSDGQDGPVRGIQVILEACDSELVFEILRAEKGQPVPASIVAKGNNLCNVLKPDEKFMGGTSNFMVTGKGEIGEERWKIDFGTVKFNTISASAAFLIHPTESGVPFMTVDVHSHGLNIDDLMRPGDSRESASADDPLDENRGASLPGETASESNKETAQKILAI